MGPALKTSTLVAAVVLVVLAGLAYWLEQGARDPTENDSLFGVTADAITRVEILAPESKRVVVERGDDGFDLVAPIETDADEHEIELLLSNLATMRAIRTLERDAELDGAEFGLDQPKLEVIFEVAGSADPFGLIFGNDTMTPSNQYAQRLGAPAVLIVGTHAAMSLTKSAWDLRDKTIFRDVPEEAEPTRVVIRRGGETVELAKSEARWTTRTGPRARVDPSEVTGMAWAFRNAKMLDLAEAWSEPPRARLDVTFDDDDALTLSLEIGAQRNVDYAARVPDRESAFLIEGGLAESLARDVASLWSKQLIDVSPETVETIVVETSRDERTLGGDDAKAFAGALFSTRADAVVPTRPDGNAGLVLTLATEDRNETLAFYERGDGEGAVLARPDEDVSLVLSAASWREIVSRVVP